MKRQADEIIPLLEASSYRYKGAPVWGRTKKSELRHRPHLLLLDITMPVMNGFEAARRIKHEFPSTHIPVVSQYDSAPFAREAIVAGASECVPKSNASTELIPMLKNHPKTWERDVRF